MSAVAEAAAALDSRWVLLAFLAVLNVWAISLVVFSKSAVREKGLWCLVILFCPILGCIFWYVMGPKPDLVDIAESDATTDGRAGAG